MLFFNWRHSRIGRSPTLLPFERAEFSDRKIIRVCFGSYYSRKMAPFLAQNSRKKVCGGFLSRGRGTGAAPRGAAEPPAAAMQAPSAVGMVGHLSRPSGDRGQAVTPVHLHQKPPTCAFLKKSFSKSSAVSTARALCSAPGTARVPSNDLLSLDGRWVSGP